MAFTQKIHGFTLIELIAIVTVIGTLLAAGGVYISKFAARRSVDRVTTNISSTLQITKLKALRHGLEYQTVLRFAPVEKTLTIVTQRGDSNRGSTNYENETSQTIRVKKGVTITPANKTYNFNPNGTLGGASGTVTIRPNGGERGERCGRIVVSPFGRIRVIQGNWDGTSVCKPVK